MSNNEVYATYPVSLIVKDRPCLVVGGGRVAARKIAGLVRAGANVTVIAPEIDPAISALDEAGRVVIKRRSYQAHDVIDSHYVITATGDRSVDAQVSHDAQAAGIWVNSADDPANCTAMLPAIYRDGPVSISVSTGGAAPALSVWIRDQIERVVSDRVGELALLMSAARDELHAQGRSTERLDWMSLLDGDLPELVNQGRIDEAKARIGQLITTDAADGHHATD